MISSIETFGVSDIGLSRQNNEDVWAELPDDHFYVLADGMGGHLAGEVAAKEAVLHFCDAVDKYFRSPTPPTTSSAKRYIGETFISANSWIRRLSKDHPDLSGMGTTLCCLLLLDNKIIVGHVGDSRIYRYRKELLLLTRDHSLEQETSGRSRSYKLTRALGISPAIEPDLLEAPCQKGDVYLLCTDGLTDALSDKQIEAIFRRHTTLKETALELIDAAKEGGSHDNITLLLVRIPAEDL
ncbi:MAG: serine/threonine-protein phosphatase [Rhabdochlamydiaceae bacterium]|nr:serine/threonine-protein phosphatase [Rhabdochlamydiaceae bacterium]